ncbi:MAG TPA: SCO family protein [Candidatus Sulfotelmatobacter sp.]|nr:SCO family protein [Candidatus Sulfotelmatobacter sp.]
MPHANSAKPTLLLILLFTALFLSCAKHGSPSAKRYPFTGRIVSLDKANQSAIIDGDAIPGFMDAMAMDYKIKLAADFSQLAAGDSISAEVVVAEKKDEAPDYWLENVKVTGHAKPASGKADDKPTTELHVPNVGEEVPDFEFTNQNSRRISLKKYRGQVLFVTFVYTRCPFPDYCPRVGAQFEKLHQQLGADPTLARKTHLLCISFDPEHDTPKVLRDYGFSLAHSHDAALFDSWEFAVPAAADLPQIARYFALSYKPENGLITHSLSTAVIGPDGKIVSWYHGSDWQVADLVKDAAGALRAQS